MFLYLKLTILFKLSFTNLDNLSKVIDEFTSDLCKIEIQLASQPYIETGNVAQMSSEIDVIRVKNNLFLLFLKIYNSVG